MIDVEKVRQRILDLAIRGKLVPQDPNDEPASVLLERIREEQIKLHREGKIKKLPEFSYIYRGSDNRYYEKRGNSCQDITNEIPFELPQTWVWARVGSISNYGSVISANNEDINDSDWVLELEDIEGYSSKLLVKERKGGRTVGSTKHRFQKGDLLISKLRMYLKKVLVADEDGFCSSEIMPTSFLPFCQNEFAKHFYVSRYLLTRVDQLQYGCKMPRLGTKDGKNLLFPLPPEKEQKRIISKVTEIDSLLMRIGTLDNELQRLSLLLKRKVLSTVFSSDKSYYGPLHQTTLGELIPRNKVGDGDWVLSEDMDETGDYRLVQLKHIGFGEYINKPYQRVNKRFFVDKKCSEIKEGYLLINRLVAGKMYVCLLPQLPFKTITSVDVCWVKPDQNYSQDYLMYYLMSPQFQESVLLSSSGSTRKRISKTALLQIEISIHEKQQQELVVQSIKDIFALFESVFD